MFKVTHGVSYEIQSVIEAIAAAAHQAPILLSSQENSDFVVSIRSKTGVNKNLDADTIQVMMLDGTHLTYADTTGTHKML